MPSQLRLSPAKMAEQWMGLQRALDSGMKSLASVTEEDVAIAQTPKDLVYEEDRVKVYRYKPRVKKPLATPTLLVYALVGRVTVVDVHPGLALSISCSTSDSTCSWWIGATRCAQIDD